MDRNIDLEIGGRRFAVSCPPGEEAHVISLARMIDAKARDAGAVGLSEPRMLLFAALMLADELQELRGGRSAAPNLEALAAKQKEREQGIASRIDSITSRVENIARHLEGSDRHA